MRCPELVGRDAELGQLTLHLDALAGGRGGLVALVGEGGAGKSRLLEVAAQEAANRGARVFWGRATPGASPQPYRPLREAMLAAFRSEPLPTDPSLQGFEGHLGRVVPSATAPAAEDSPLLVAEAVARLLAVVGGTAGCLLILEDVHWADPETLEVLDYFADALSALPVLCLVSTRPDRVTEDRLGRLDRADPERVLRVELLTDDEVIRMVGACLGVPDPPPEVAQFVAANSDGNPFLVEELLAGLVSAGQLREDAGYWTTGGPLIPSVPASLRDSIERRLSSLSPVDRRVVAAAALLGRSFEWDLLPGIAEVDGRAAADALRAAVAQQLIDVDGDGFMFRHALTREAVLAALLPPERRDLAGRAWPAIERANPGLPGPACELAADLAEAAGDRPAAATRLVESARRALVEGALATAEATARRARALAEGLDDGVATEADEVLVHVLAAAGKPAGALRLGRDLAVRLEAGGAPEERRVHLLVAITRAAIAAGDLSAASAAVADARRTAAAEADPATDAQIDALAGEVALDQDDLGEAERLIRRAIDGARATDQPAVLCEALLTLGRILRTQDHAAAGPCISEAVSVAAAAGLPRWHLRAQHEAALSAWIEHGTKPLEDTRALAARYGAHVTVAVMDLSLADTHLSSFDQAACLRHASACVDASRRFGLATEPVAYLWLAGAHALGGDDDAMQAAIDEALRRDPDDPRILGDLYGRVLVTRAFVRDELDTLRPLTDTMMTHVRRAPPATSVYPGRILWTLLCTMDDDDLGAAARADFTEVARVHSFPMFVQSREIIEGVASGRAGDPERALALAAPAYQAMQNGAHRTGVFQSLMLLVSQAAIRDGWGEPERWLRSAEAFFTEQGFPLIARRCRTLLAEAGAPVPRRRGTTEVPQALRALGVTGREVDVLKLVVAGRTNKEIAAELVLSPKTVERHLSSLFGRLSVRDRRSLAEMGGAHLP